MLAVILKEIFYKVTFSHMYLLTIFSKMSYFTFGSNLSESNVDRSVPLAVLSCWIMTIFLYVFIYFFIFFCFLSWLALG